jgi:large subunit ribosomal protein L29
MNQRRVYEREARGDSMTGAEVRKLTDEEIQIETKRLRGRLVTLRTQVVTEKVEDTSEFRKVKKDIARMLTEASARAAKGSKK